MSAKADLNSSLMRNPTCQRSVLLELLSLVLMDIVVRRVQEVSMAIVVKEK